MATDKNGATHYRGAVLSFHINIRPHGKVRMRVRRKTGFHILTILLPGDILASSLNNNAFITVTDTLSAQIVA